MSTREKPEKGKEYEFIKPLKEKPILKTKQGKESVSQKIVQEFLKSNLEYAEVPLTGEKDTRGLMIGIGRYLKSKNIGNIQVRRDINDRVVLLRKKS